VKEPVTDRLTPERLSEIRDFVSEQNGRMPHVRNGLDCHVVADLLAHLDAVTRERDEAVKEFADCCMASAKLASEINGLREKALASQERCC
jgi:hypothetical protein